MKGTILILLSASIALAQSGTITKVVSTASGALAIAPNSLATIYGANLANSTAAAAGMPLPNQLAGISVVVDGLGISTGTTLIYVSPTQINFLMPAGIPSGTLNVRVVSPEIIIASGTAQVQAVAPGLFSANGTGSGPAAAISLRVTIPIGIQSTVPVVMCDAALGNCQLVPIDVGVDAPVYLELFGTGIRGGKNYSVTVGGQSVPVLYAGPQNQHPGLDQVNIPMALSLRGAGTVNVVLTVDGVASNAVQIEIQ